MTAAPPPSSSGTPDLRPCPFCGASAAAFRRTGQRWQTVACSECGAEGPCTEIDRDLIIQKWNTRSSPTPQIAGGVRDEILALSPQAQAGETLDATEQGFLEDNIATVAHHLGRPGATMQVDHPAGGLNVSTGEVLKEVSRRLGVAQASPDRDAVARIIDPVAFNHIFLKRESAEHRQREAREKADAILALPSPPAPLQAVTWQPIETAPKNRLLLVGFFNAVGKWRSMHAQYRDDLPQHDDAGDDDEPAEAGWYEGSLEAEMLFPVRPTHWQLLPAAPSVPPSTDSGDAAK